MVCMKIAVSLALLDCVGRATVVAQASVVHTPSSIVTLTVNSGFLRNR